MRYDYKFISYELFCAWSLGRSNYKLWEKNHQVHLIITKEWSNPPFLWVNLDNFLTGAFYSIAHNKAQKSNSSFRVWTRLIPISVFSWCIWMITSTYSGFQINFALWLLWILSCLQDKPNLCLETKTLLYFGPCKTSLMEVLVVNSFRKTFYDKCLTGQKQSFGGALYKSCF